MKKISLLLVVSFAAIVLSACSASPKVPTSAVPNPSPVAVEKTDPSAPPTAQPPANPETNPVPTPAPTPPPASDPVVTVSEKPSIPPRSSGDSLAVPTATPTLVTLQSFSFRPANMMIRKGETIKWINKDSVPHTVTSDSFRSETLQTNDSFSSTFNEEGTFSYSCGLHPSMRGTIVVKP